MLPGTRLIDRSLTFALLCIGIWSAGVWAQGRYEIGLAKAEQAYNEGYFDQVVELANACLKNGDLTIPEQTRAYKLLGQAHASKNEPQTARMYVQKLLEVAPDFEPDREHDLQVWIDLIDEVKPKPQPLVQNHQVPGTGGDEPVVAVEPMKNDGGKKWLWLGSGVTVVTAGVVYMLISQQDPKESRKSTGFTEPEGRP